MATTAYPLNHPLAVKTWSKRVFVEALKETYINRFIGTGTGSLIVRHNDVQKGPGDRIRVPLRMQLTGAGTADDDTLEGLEESLTTYSDDVFINQLRHAVRSDGRMSEQRIPFEIREHAKDGLRDWLSDRMDTAFFNAIAGNTTQTDTKYTGSNATTAPSTTSGNSRIIYGPVSTTENSLSAESASSNFQLTLIDKAIATAKTASPFIRPLRVNGEDKYVCFLHPYQVYSLRTDATAGRVTWYDANKSRISGGEMSNGIFTGALGEYNGVILHESTRIPLAPSTTTVRRAVFCGAQAASLAFGQASSSGEASWREELFDYGNQLGVGCGIIWGLKKAVFNGIDFSTIVIATHAEAP